ncbi:UNVERIFIED_CONTAM: Polygalacturonase [Sesamum radiatum]|uniref:Epidermal patterning factor-like protein n=1 Tax=Sesamum radiatum TaxID=300843 RepID=A0AAW2LPC6_SESRA
MKLSLFMCLPFFLLNVVDGATTQIKTQDQNLYYLKNLEKTLDEANSFGSLVGSRPPDCSNKCGTCTPCKLALVGVPPKPMLRDYYPVRWKCQCKGKLYDP